MKTQLLLLCCQSLIAGAFMFMPLPVCAENATTGVGQGDRIDFARQSHAYAIDLLQRFSRNNGDRNLIFSPLSIQFALGMLRNAADAELDERIAKAMHMDNQPPTAMNRLLGATIPVTEKTATTDAALDIANALFIDRQYEAAPAFRQALTTYQEEIEALDFSSPKALAAINGWVGNKTCGRIPSIVEELPAGGKAALINTIFFKGQWPEDFSMKNGPGLNGSTAAKRKPRLPQWSRGGLSRYYEDQGLQAIYLPYHQHRYALLVLLPKTDGKAALSRMISNLDAAYFGKILHQSAYPDKNYEGTLYLPRFEATYHNDKLAEQSRKLLGVDLKNATLPNMLILRDNERPIPPFRIEVIIHKAAITVNEQGTEAAAVTTVIPVPTAIPFEAENKAIPFEMRVNKPFAYALIDKASQILFLSAVHNLP